MRSNEEVPSRLIPRYKYVDFFDEERNGVMKIDDFQSNAANPAAVSDPNRVEYSANSVIKQTNYSDDWLNIQKRVEIYWNSARVPSQKLPTFTPNISETLAPVATNLAILEVLWDRFDFRYYSIGTALSSTVGRDFSGETILSVARYNLKNFGVSGLQGELLSLFSQSVMDENVLEYHGLVFIPPRTLKISAIVTPFTTDGRRADYLIAGAMFSPQSAN